MTHELHSTVGEPDRPTNDEAPGVTAEGFNGQARTNNGDSAATAVDVEADKEFSTLRAMLAMRGFELHTLSEADGGTAYLVRRWSMTRELPDLPAVAAFAERAGVQS